MLARRLLSLAVLAAVHGAVVPLTAPAFAQVRAPQQDLVQRGQQLFDDQQYEESVQTLSAALLRPSNTKAHRIEIYRLLALNYITLNRRDEAESAVRGLLSIEPSYALPATESPRFRDFFGTVRAKWEEEGRPGLVKETEPPPAPVSMKHASPSQASAGAQLDLAATLEDPGKRVTLVRMYFRTGSKGKFVAGDAVLDGARVRATIPASAVSPPLVEYYLQGFDRGGLPLVSRGDAAAPLRVAVPDEAKGWVLPVAIGGGVLGAAAIVGGLALAGVFKSSSKSAGPGTSGGGNANVIVSVGEQRWGARW